MPPEFAGQLDEGIAKVREVLAADSDVIEAHTMLGNMDVKAHRLPEAIGAYRKALAIDPDWWAQHSTQVQARWDAWRKGQ